MRQLQDILVIDDEPTVTQAVAKICGAEGMTVSTAGQASEALKKLEECNFRLMLCDIMMPELNGFQFLEELARRGIRTPVVMMTGYSTMENAVRSLTSTGAVDYIPKPFTADELLTVTQRSLRCGMLLDEAESASLPRSGAMSYVPCPVDYYRCSLPGELLQARLRQLGPDGGQGDRKDWSDRLIPAGSGGYY